MAQTTRWCSHPGCAEPARWRFRGPGADSYACDQHKEAEMLHLFGLRMTVERFVQ